MKSNTGFKSFFTSFLKFLRGLGQFFLLYFEEIIIYRDFVVKVIRNLVFRLYFGKEKMSSKLALFDDSAHCISYRFFSSFFIKFVRKKYLSIESLFVILKTTFRRFCNSFLKNFNE